MTWKLGFRGYSAATKVAPEWTPAYLVYQGGIPRVRLGSLTGSGQVYAHEFEGTFTPIIKGYVPGILATGGPGQIVSRPPWLQALIGGQRGQGS